VTTWVLYYNFALEVYDMMDLSGKRLLIMGGVPNARDIVKKAHELGVHVMVTDYLEDSPAKKIADESFMVSTTDIDAVVKLCQMDII
jgi:formate-dependent phosphoribosylglycinamide formyltransferase (GAR transformylase)